eukprot:5025843-Pyramimonas_sp.AAC.1
MGNISTGAVISLLRDCVTEVEDSCLVGFTVPTLTAQAEISAHSELRTAGVFKGDGVWAALDEGRDSRCYGKAWALNAVGKFEQLGVYSPWVHRRRKTRSGVGGQAGSATTGEKSIPLRIVASRGAVRGCLESHQLGDSAPLGLAKDIVHGRAPLSQDCE